MAPVAASTDGRTRLMIPGRPVASSAGWPIDGPGGAGRPIVARTRADLRRIAFLGFGLIGGSIAMALRARSDLGSAATEGAPNALHLAAWTPSGRGPAIGLARGLLDAAPASPGEAVANAEIVVLAAPPLATLDLLGSLAGDWRHALREGAVITDVASTKAAVVARADEVGLPFVGGHPMAGRELAGVDAGSADLFVGRPWVVVAGRAATSSMVARVERLVRRAGAKPVRMTAPAHDAAVAAISHLPLVVAAALVEIAAGGDDWPTARTLAASGWRDATRLASGDPEMGAGILATNAEAVADRLADLRAAIDGWLELLRPGSAVVHEPELRVRLAAARRILGSETAPE